MVAGVRTSPSAETNMCYAPLLPFALRGNPSPDIFLMSRGRIRMWRSWTGFVFGKTGGAGAKTAPMNWIGSESMFSQGPG